jgi:endonuclease/exonuclease/phosphatase family metal-dependent hydrolase
MKRILFFLVALIITAPQISNAQNELANEDNYLRILSWNIYMLPGIANLSKGIDKSYKRDRSRQIAEVMNNSNYNIIVFQEAFFGPARKILSKQLKEKYPYQYGPVNPSGLGLKTSSGVWIISEIPLKELGTTRYRTCDGADCFAKKGAGLYEGEWNGKPFQVLGTHLNAGGPVWIREEQFKQIRDDLLQPFQKLGVPQIICGDMNTRLTRTEAYNFMIETLDVIDVPVSNQRKSTKPPKEGDEKTLYTTATDSVFIDYIFHRPNGSNMKVIDKRVVTFKANPTFPVDVLRGTLSDHLALEIVLDLK